MDYIPTYEASCLVVKRSQATPLRKKEEIPDEEEDLDLYGLWNELDDYWKIAIAEAPVPISIQEFLDAQKTKRISQEILFGSAQAGGQSF